jgi:surfeit locus 1 family protein
MPGRVKILALFAIAAAAVCIRLGFWQIQRLQERRASNAHIGARLHSPEASVSLLDSGATDLSYRRLRFTGSRDPVNEFVLAGRSRDGAPGVNIVTPYLPEGGHTIILVNRGWVYSPDATTIDPAKFSETRPPLSGFLIPIPSDTGPNDVPGHPRTFRRVDRNAVPYTVFPYYLMATGDSARSDSGALILRAANPQLNDGAHVSYAVQWFAFAAVSLIGTAVVIARTRRPDMAGGAEAQSMHDTQKRIAR